MGEECHWGQTMSAFKRLNIIAEGQTEERFVNDTLSRYLSYFSIDTRVRCVETGRKYGKKFSGGLDGYEKAKNDIERWIREDRNNDVYFTTMFDFYALPEEFPGWSDAIKMSDPYEKVAHLEAELKKDIGDRRFIPYIQLHEFEALIFVDPAKLTDIFFEAQNSIATFEQITEKFNGNPELINEGPETAPSQRIIKVIPAYKFQKPTAGAGAVGNTGIPKLKERCRHFREWIEQLESLGTPLI